MLACWQNRRVDEDMFDFRLACYRERYTLPDVIASP